MQNNIPRGVFSIPRNSSEMAEANKYLAPKFQNSMVGATVGPIARGDVAFARALSNKVDSGQYINPEQYEILLKIAKNNLNIPKNIFNKMNPSKLISELLGLAEKPR